MEDKILCSVIIPVYNSRDYILECLQSIVREKKQQANIEAIVIDDGSSDGTVQIIHDHFKNNKQVRILEQHNQGPCVARNNGIRIARGEYLLFVDSDDLLSPDFWQYLIPILCTGKYDVVWFGLQRFIDGQQPFTFRESQKTKKTPIEILGRDLDHLKACTLYYDSSYGNRTNDMYGISVSTAGGSCWRRSIQICQEIWWHDDVKIHTDGIFNLQMIGFCNYAAYIPRSLYYYRVHEASISSRVWDHAEHLFAKRNEVARTILNELYRVSMADTQNEYVQRYYASLVFQIGVIMERDIFSRKSALTLQEKKQRFTELKEFYGTQDKVSLLILSDHDKKILTLYKKSFIYNYIRFYAANLYHTVGSIIKGRKQSLFHA